MESLKIKYTTSINQAALLVSGLIGKVDAIDMIVFDFLWHFKDSKAAAKMNSYNHMWFSCHWSVIVKQLPIIKIKTRSGINKRISNLKNAEILIPHPDNGKGGKAWFRMGDVTDKLHFLDQSDISAFINRGQGVSNRGQGVYPIVDSFNKKPVSNRGHNNNTSNNRTSYNTTLLEDVEKIQQEDNIKGFIEMLKQDQIFFEEVQIKYKVSESEINKMMMDFVRTKRAIGELNHKSASDFKKNFFYWIPKGGISGLKKQKANGHKKDSYDDLEKYYENN